jgi:GDP-D-mannose dehydratase
MITREAARILHQECNVIGNVNTQYDDQYAQEGAKIGYSLNIRMPTKYEVRTGATLSAEDHVERSTPLAV